MYSFNNSIGGLSLSIFDNKKTGGGKSVDEPEIIPLGLVFINKTPKHKTKLQQEIINEPLNDKKYKKLYKKIKRNKPTPL